jgi:hypothetical protein
MGVAARRNKDGPLHKFMQIGTTDTAPGYIYAHSAGFYRRFGDIFNPDIPFVIKTSSFYFNLLAFN